jgi:hypothetical protein
MFVEDSETRVYWVLGAHECAGTEFCSGLSAATDRTCLVQWMAWLCRWCRWWGQVEGSRLGSRYPSKDANLKPISVGSWYCKTVKGQATTQPRNHHARINSTTTVQPHFCSMSLTQIDFSSSTGSLASCGLLIRHLQGQRPTQEIRNARKPLLQVHALNT